MGFSVSSLLIATVARDRLFSVAMAAAPSGDLVIIESSDEDAGSRSAAPQGGANGGDDCAEFDLETELAEIMADDVAEGRHSVEQAGGSVAAPAPSASPPSDPLSMGAVQRLLDLGQRHQPPPRQRFKQRDPALMMHARMHLQRQRHQKEVTSLQGQVQQQAQDLGKVARLFPAVARASGVDIAGLAARVAPATGGGSVMKSRRKR